MSARISSAVSTLRVGYALLLFAAVLSAQRRLRKSLHFGVRFAGSGDAVSGLDVPARGLGGANRFGELLAGLQWRAWLRTHAPGLAVVGTIGSVVGLVHAWGMDGSPAFFDDEGTYVSQAWAVDSHHVLAPYTYWYDHPPLGWIFLAGWAKVIPTFGATIYSVAAARTFILALLVASSLLLYVVARRLGLGRPIATLAVLLFALSPLALHYQRMVLLDNIAVFWLLAGFALALTPSRRLFAFAAAGVCLAAAVLTKETFLLFAPALFLLVWERSQGATRRFACGMFVTLFVMVGGFFPLFALLRGEFFPGPHHTSLIQGVRFQLGRVGGGSLFDASSGTRGLISSWLSLDPVVLAGGVALLPLGLVVKRLRPFAIALVIPVSMAARPGAYIPAMYVIGLLPFAALLTAAAIDVLWGWHWVAREGWRTLPTRLAASFAALAAAALTAGVAVAAARSWPAADLKQMRTDEAAPDRAAVAWLAKHADHRSRLLVDDTVWVDLVERGFAPQRTVWFYKLDLDPAVRIPWWKFDFVVRSNLFAGNLYWLPDSRRVFDHSRIVRVFANGDERIEIRRVIKPRRREERQ
jgi:4-amino-4-deoxy-L-arabinose transferase-like glycosyltransferase